MIPLRTALLGGIVITTAYAFNAASFVSSLDNSLQITQYVAPVMGAGSPNGISSTWSLSVDDTLTGHKQKMDGFGAAVRCHASAAGIKHT